VVRLENGRCLVQTVDFFTPIVDDPATFGAIAATNSLSDIWAMGGEPFSAMNILCWPVDDLPLEALEALLQGAFQVLQENGVLLVGGHSVRDTELKFGLSVTGFVEEDRIWTNAGAVPGDVLVLTRAIGTGVVSTAVKRDVATLEVEQAAIDAMLTSNRAGRDAGRQVQVHAATDITGNGLAGHAWEMARASGVRIELFAGAIPLLPGALDLAGQDMSPGGMQANRRYVGQAFEGPGCSEAFRALLFDPQTSGGLLFSLSEADAHRLLVLTPGFLIGRVVAGRPAVAVLGS
jgi:selenide, water dikinase